MNATASEARLWEEDGLAHIDVRNLAAPRPLVEILRRIAELPRGQLLIVHHDRMPLLLFPELDQIGWQAEVLDAPAGEVRLLLRQAA